VAELWTGDSSTTEVVDLETGEHRYEVKTGERPFEPDDEAERRLALSADASRVATIDPERVLRVRTVTDGGLVGAHASKAFEPTWVVLDGDGSTLACALVRESDRSGAVVVWELETARVASVAHEVGVSRERSLSAPASSALSDDGTLLALSDDRGYVEGWAVEGPTLVAEFGEQLEPDVMGNTWSDHPPLAFSRDNRRLAHGGLYGTAVRVWDLESEEMTHELFGLISVPQDIVFGPTGEILAAGGFEGVCAWDLSVPQELPEAGAHRPGGTLEFAAVSPSGRLAVLSHEGAAAVVWIDSGAAREEERHPHNSAWPSEACRVQPEQDLIAAAFGPGDRLLAGVDGGGILYVWDLDDGEELAQMDLALETKERYDGEAAVAFGPHSLLACAVDGVLYACDWEDRDVLASASGGFDEMRWTPDGRFVALGGGKPRALDVEEDELLTGDDALHAVADAYGGMETAARLNDFASLDPHERVGVRRFGWMRGRRDDMVRISRLDGTAEFSWRAESPLYDARFVGPGVRVVAVTVAGAIAVLEPVVPPAVG